MNKELIDSVWRVLPTEFKEEVKRMWSVEGDCAIKYKSELHKHRTDLLYELFGNNLTSDAEGEEMLTVPRKEIQKIYCDNCVEIHRECVSSSDKDCYQTVNEVLKTLFGSKCLLDEESKSCEELLDEMNNVADKIIDKIEPKFKNKEGDTVRYKGQNHEIGKIAKYWGEEDPGKYSVCFGKEYHNISESMLELYEPEEIISLKEKYWQTGNIFEMSTGEKRVVWFDNLIDAGGFIPKALFNDNLVNTDSTIGEHVIRIYAPNTNSGYFKELTKTRGKNLLWRKSDYIFTEQEIKEKLRIPEEEELIIIK